MDNSESHTTAEFIQLTNYNHILPYLLLVHLTHCTQPLDFGIFHLYKQCHDIAIREALSGLDVEYNLRSFLRDVPLIRRRTLEKSNIGSTFKKSGMYSISTGDCL